MVVAQDPPVLWKSLRLLNVLDIVGHAYQQPHHWELRLYDLDLIRILVNDDDFEQR